MFLSGDSLIGRSAVRGEDEEVVAVSPLDGARLEPVFPGVTRTQLRTACALASDAFDQYRETSLPKRAEFLNTIAEQIIDLGDALIERAHLETGLPTARLIGERGRTVGQLRLFAELVVDGSWLEVRIDSSQPERQPVPKPDLRLRQVPLGPVAVFGASNFPLAFSVAGGDTASALAAGCPVVVKAHAAHPGTSELVGRAVQAAVVRCGLHEGVFSLLFASGVEIGVELVRDSRIKAVGFTGSRGGGLALMAAAAARSEPIPVYAEMSSINPLLIMPGALAVRAGDIAIGFIASLNLGAGQFCTNPGLVLAVEGEGLDTFLAAASDAMSKSIPATMLTGGIHTAYLSGVERLGGHPGVKCIGEGPLGTLNQAQAYLFTASAETLLHTAEMHQEVFGPSSLVVRCRSVDEMRRTLEQLEGQLTATVHMESSDAALVRGLMPTLERKAGRVLMNGFPTGVEVAHAMVHGGPFPAASDGRSTSVGTLAIRRFLRPVCYQDVPPELLPDALADGNPLNLLRMIDGKLRKD